MISCPLCTKSFNNPSRVHLHMVSHTKEKPYNCLLCSATFGRDSSLKQHIQRVHDGIKKIKSRNTHCLMCSYKCYSKTQLQIHLRKHSDELPFFCETPSCGYKTKYKNCLKQHVRAVHSGVASIECPSDGCSYMAKTRAHLSSHLRTHSTDRPFTCQFPGCNHTCKSKGYLKAHTSSAHSAVKPLKCSTCDFRAKSKSNLMQHQLTHTEIKRFRCQAPNCGYASHAKSKVERHFDSIHKKKDVLCTEPGCNFKCGSTNLLQRHLTKHGKRIFKCPLASCNFSTRYRYCLKQHVSNYHSDEQSAAMSEPRTFEGEPAGAADVIGTLHYCSFPNCGFQTKFPHHYDRHTITHKKEEKRRHVCSFCFSRFSFLSLLKAHVRRHVREKPYSCSHCKYTNVHCHDLVKHARRIHDIHVIRCGKEDEARKCRTCDRKFLSYSESVLHSLSHLQPVVVLQRLKLCVF